MNEPSGKWLQKMLQEIVFPEESLSVIISLTMMPSAFIFSRSSSNIFPSAPFSVPSQLCPFPLLVWWVNQATFPSGIVIECARRSVRVVPSCQVEIIIGCNPLLVVSTLTYLIAYLLTRPLCQLCHMLLFPLYYFQILVL